MPEQEARLLINHKCPVRNKLVNRLDPAAKRRQFVESVEKLSECSRFRPGTVGGNSVYDP